MVSQLRKKFAVRVLRALHNAHLRSVAASYVRRPQNKAFKHSVLVGVFTLVATDGRLLQAAVDAAAECNLWPWQSTDKGAWTDKEEFADRVDEWVSRLVSGREGSQILNSNDIDTDGIAALGNLGAYSNGFL